MFGFRIPDNLRTRSDVTEVNWFVDLSNGDTEFLGVLDEGRRANFQNCLRIVQQAEAMGFSGILLPNAYDVGQDPLTFAAGLAAHTERISPIVAVRMGELHPPMLGRTLATLDHLLRGRLIINIISSDPPGLSTPAAFRYERSGEIIEILRQGWTQDRIRFQGQHYEFDLPSDPVKPYQQNGGPLLYFGGISDPAKDLAAREADVYLMWPETENQLADTIQDVARRAEAYGRTIDFGLRIHLVVRETEAEARAWCRRLTSRLDRDAGLALRARGQDSVSYGVWRQDELRKNATPDGYIEPLVWSEIGRAWSGCGSALVGSAEQIAEKLERYRALGIRSFIFSGFPLYEECSHAGHLLLPLLSNRVSLAELQHRTPPTEPVTPLTTAVLR